MATTDPRSSARSERRLPPEVTELSAPYGNLLLAPRAGAAVCALCFNFTDGDDRCRACRANDDALDVLLPISYSIGGEQLHHALASYKRTPAHWYEPFSRQLGAVLWRFIDQHERCVARAAGVAAFPLVTTVPSGEPLRDPGHPLHRIVGERVGPTRDRHRRLATRVIQATPHVYDAGAVTATAALRGEPVLVIDDMWTTGATVQATAAALNVRARARSPQSSSAATSTASGTTPERGSMDCQARSIGAAVRSATARVCKCELRGYVDLRSRSKPAHRREERD